jgi:REP element-mobilizing transposase RayT
MPLAYLITFTTYGTWLHGSAKNSVDDSHNVYGTSYVEPDGDREFQASQAMKQSPYVLSAAERAIACKAVVDLSSNRGWDLLAIHVRSNHIHIVVSADRDPARIMSDVKSRISRALTTAGFDDADRRRWTRHGSTKHLFREEDVEAALRYVLEKQGERMAWYAKKGVKINDEGAAHGEFPGGTPEGVPPGNSE